MSTIYPSGHPDFELPEGVAIPEGFEDNSWKNDALPNWHNEALNVSLWIDYPLEESETCDPDNWKQFHVDQNAIIEGDYNQDEVSTSFDAWAEANAFIEFIVKLAEANTKTYMVVSGMKSERAETVDEAVSKLCGLITCDREEMTKQLVEKGEAHTVFGLADGCIYSIGDKSE